MRLETFRPDIDGFTTPMRGQIALPLLLTFLAAASFARVWMIDGVMWDDNAWLMSVYSTKDLDGFLATGFVEMRRIPQGVFLYVLFWLHKNTELYFATWHTLNMATQIGTPILLYATCLRLFDQQRLLAFLIAASLVAVPIDQTLAHAASINYRLGLLFGVASFYLTARALTSDRRVLPTLASVVSALIAYVVFMEAVVALEPGRLAMIAYLLNRRHGVQGKQLAKTVAVCWLPYLAACLPFSAYRLLFRSYGAYADIYQPNLLFWLDWQDNINLLAMLLFFQWTIFVGYIKEAAIWTYVLGSTSLVMIFFVIRAALTPPAFASNVESKYHDTRSIGWYAFMLGITLMLPALLLFQIFGRSVTWGLHSSHGTIGQFGYAVVLGSSLFLLLRYAIGNKKQKAGIYTISVALLLSTGVFFNNLNLDIYYSSHKKLATFWTAFVDRFPDVPPNSTFLIDLRNNSFYAPQYHGAFEFPLNLLYARNLDPETFRRYRVSTPSELQALLESAKRSVSELVDARIVRPTPWGTDEIEPANFVVVYFDESGILVNHEITRRFPNTPFREILNKKVPQFPKEEGHYPFRHKILGRS